VVGNERHGISRPWFDYGFAEVTVPMQGRADSLNVSVSASILLYEIRRRGRGADLSPDADLRRNAGLRPNADLSRN
jgi:tRNA(Leu) C34 or U34 (ribose-2'-O)-methylase TrmL